ncbi:fungal-specific transcription factor domain-containing protein [Scheffersomyces xylosifermentans]|uniref:fungal-specific transcription factor domain-containing protein n=1 Tax=Scheffersomyces xylosifermentans TaxID=1304137 RepID=UPI00315DABB2
MHETKRPRGKGSGMSQRKKITRACDTCKHRKMKCNGQQPCMFCKKRGMSCSYLKVDGRSTKGRSLKAIHTRSELSTKQTTSSTSSESYPMNSSNSISSTSSTNPQDLRKPDEKSGTSSNSLSLAAICQNLQSSLTSAAYERAHISSKEDKYGVPKLDGKHSRLLQTQSGDLRYYGELSPFSFLNECRSLFKATIGISKFTIIPEEEILVSDRVLSHNDSSLPLPSRDSCNMLIRIFKENINDTYYVFDMEDFVESVVDPIYKISARKESNLCLYNLVMAIGALYAEFTPEIDNDQLDILKSSDYFDCAQNIMRDVCYDEKLWIAQAHFLHHFYYLSKSQKSSSWLHLGSTVRIAQALGLHRKVVNERFGDVKICMHRRRLWRSIFICDRIASINLGRPLSISDYDWDDYDDNLEINTLDSKEEAIQRECHLALCNIARINGRIVENLLRSGSISVKKSNMLSHDLKMWSHGLVDELKLSSELEAKLTEPDRPNNFNLVLVHLCQFYGIMTLGRPFLVHAVTRKLNPENKNPDDFNDVASLMTYSKSCIKAAFLVIKLLTFYRTYNKSRREVFSSVSCCFYAALVLGLTLLYQKSTPHPDPSYIALLEEAIGSAHAYLEDLSKFDSIAKCWALNLSNLQDALQYDFLDSVELTSLGSLEDCVEDDFDFEAMSMSGSYDKQTTESSECSEYDDMNEIYDDLVSFRMFYALNAPTGTSCLKDLIDFTKNYDLDAFKYDSGQHMVLGGE